MDHTMRTASAATHLKVVCLSLIISTAVVLAALLAPAASTTGMDRSGAMSARGAGSVS